MSRFLLFALLLFPACDDTSEKDDTSATTETLPDAFPDDPSPFTLEVAGGLEQSLVFDEPECTQQVGSANLRVFWRGSDHAFVLIAEIMGEYDGVGTYDTSSTAVRVKLQEEAGGTGFYFAADTSAGDSATIIIHGADEVEEQIWGDLDVTGLHGGLTGEDYGITLSPMPVPVWCPSLN